MKRFIVILASLLWTSTAHAVSTITLNWQDNSSNEAGFKIERANSSSGPFSQIATVGANVTSYVNANLSEATQYCYRVRAFNIAGSSPYTGAVCAVTKAVTTNSALGASVDRYLGDEGRGTDFDGDNKADIAVYQNGAWRIVRSSDGSLKTVTLGSTSQDLPVPGDFDGDRAADAAVYNVTSGKWSVVGSRVGAFTASAKFGGPGYLPVAGDYDGDGKTDVAVYETANGNWFVLGSTEGYFNPAVKFGGSGYVPVPGDYDGDGVADAAVYHTATGNWFVVGSTRGYFNPALKFGGSGYIPVPGDYDGDGRTDVAVYHASTGSWHLLQSTAGYKIKSNGGSNFLPVLPQLTILKALGIL